MSRPQRNANARGNKRVVAETPKRAIDAIPPAPICCGSQDLVCRRMAFIEYSAKRQTNRYRVAWDASPGWTVAREHIACLSCGRVLLSIDDDAT